jgi:exosortase A-associated hydrolase 1
MTPVGTAAQASALDEAAVTFPCGGSRLIGIVHRATDRRIGVLLVVGGPQYRVGSHRSFVQMARAIAAAGYPVFRFDYRGMGDSEGEGVDFMNCKDDILAARDAFLAACPGLDKMVYFGLCDAASALLMHVASMPATAGLVLANPWVRTPDGQAKTYVRHYYFQRLVDREFWRKVAAGRFRWKDSSQSLLGTLRQATGWARRGERHTTYIDSMRSGLDGFKRPVLLLISQNDLTAKEFIDLANDSKSWRGLLHRPNVQVMGVAESDHTFSTQGSKKVVAESMIRFLRELR